MEQENKQITPSQYFDYLKGCKKTITTEALKSSFDTFIKLAEKYQKLGQVESLKKLCFLADTLVKEEKLIDLGITTYVYKDAIEDYIEHVADKTVKIIELSRYMREVPDEFVEVVEKTRDLFNEFYVIFTDYTGKEERKVEKERRDKDPILFGVFKDGTSVADRFYFLGDWVDEYCDLTLDKLVEQYKEKKGFSPAITTTIPETSEELVATLKTFRAKTEGLEGTEIVHADGLPHPIELYRKDPQVEEKLPFFQRIRSIFKK